MGLFNNFPYTNLENINLDYTLRKLDELYTRGENLYAELSAWKDGVDADLAAWKAETEAAITADLGEYKDEVTAAFADLTEALETHLAEIETTAIAARDAAAASALAASGSATAAAGSSDAAIKFATGVDSQGDPVSSDDPAYHNNSKYYAESIASETTQIATNTADIADLKSTIAQVVPVNLNKEELELGSVKYDNGININSETLYRTKFVNIEGITTILYTRLYTTSSFAMWGMAFYSDDDVTAYVSGEQAGLNASEYHYELKSLTVPETAKYARFTWLPSLGDFAVYDADEYDNNLESELNEAKTDIAGNASDIAENTNSINSLQNIVDDCLRQVSLVDFTQYSSVNQFIRVSDSLWANGHYARAYLIPVPNDAHSISITANSTYTTTYALLSTNNHTAGTTADFATGYTTSVTVNIDESVTVSIPQDGHYLYVLTSFDNTDKTPESVTFNSYGVETDKTLSESDVPADAKVAGDRIKQITDTITETETIDMESATVIRGLINVSNKWSTTSDFYSYAFVISKGYYKLSVTASNDSGARVGLLKSSTLISGNTPPYCEGITDKIRIPEGETSEIIIPADCTYIVITKTDGTYDYTPSSVTLYRWSVPSADRLTIPLGLHEMPKTESALNIVKRCRQMTDIKWTPAKNLKRFMLVQRGSDIPATAIAENYLGEFTAGVEYTGVPYGRVSGTMTAYGMDYATVGHYIDFETFISSVSDPNSKLCNTDVGSVGNHRSVIYATVCSGMTCYALDVPEVPTVNIGNISGLMSIGKLNDNGTLLSDSSIQIGDVLNQAGYHTAIITDIIRDADGMIQFVEISDASTAGLADRDYDDGQIGGICRRKGWTRDKLFGTGAWGDYTLYRYTKNVSYIPTPYVNIGDEFNMQRIEHFPCMPYEGNKFVYKSGYIPNSAVKILTSLSGYGYLKVFKDGTEITGSPFTVTAETTSINVEVIDAGEYSAYLCNISDGDVINLTYPCNWTITE